MHLRSTYMTQTVVNGSQGFKILSQFRVRSSEIQTVARMSEHCYATRTQINKSAINGSICLQPIKPFVDIFARDSQFLDFERNRSVDVHFHSLSLDRHLTNNTQLFNKFFNTTMSWKKHRSNMNKTMISRSDFKYQGFILAHLIIMCYLLVNNNNKRKCRDKYNTNSNGILK